MNDRSAYAGDVSPRDAWGVLAGEAGAVLVDCRSLAEWTWVGNPDLSSLGKRVVRIEWQRWNGAAMSLNPDFVAEVKRAGVAADATVVLLCRSGGRSKSAAIALTAAGFEKCLNLAGGFEGPHDGAKRRGSLAGWKAQNLPWIQD